MKKVHILQENCKNRRFICRLYLWCSNASIKQLGEEGEFKENDYVVVIFPDHGSRYMSKVYSDKWMKEQGFFDSINEAAAKNSVHKIIN